MFRKYTYRTNEQEIVLMGSSPLFIHEGVYCGYMWDKAFSHVAPTFYFHTWTLYNGVRVGHYPNRSFEFALFIMWYDHEVLLVTYLVQGIMVLS